MPKSRVVFKSTYAAPVMCNRGLLYAALFLSVAPGGTSPAFATEVVSGLEEVVVTARRRAENMQEVPISVTAFDSAEIDDLGITNIAGITELTPNLVVQPNTGGFDGVLVCMRGLCRTDAIMTEDPMVGVYMDGVYVGKSVGSLFDVAEMDSIQVLRGPQGTLYGKNTLGGAVLLTSRKPSGELSGQATATLGNFERTDFKGYLEFPITDTLAGSVSYLLMKHEPYVQNTLGDDRWSEDTQAARAALRWLPTDGVTIDYAYDWQDKDDEPLASQIVSATGFVGGYGLGDWFAQDVRVDRADTVHTYGASHNKVDISSHSLTMNFDLHDMGTFTNMALKSITGYRDFKVDVLNNMTGASTPYVYSNEIYDYNAFSQELQVSGEFGDGFGKFVVGAFYFTEDGTHDIDQEINAFYAHVLYGLEIDNSSWALFTEVALNLTEKLALSVGARYTDETRKQQHTAADATSGFVFLNTYDQTFGGLPQYYPTKLQTTDTSPRASLSYNFTDDFMTFFTYAKGFKSGGFNGRSTTPLQWSPYKDMYADSFELGVKSMWWDDRLRFNLTAFYQELHDVQSQVNAVDPGNSQSGISAVIQNAAQAHNSGFELEVMTQLTEDLKISAGYGYIDAKYDEFNSFDPITGTITDVSKDRAFEFTPSDTYNVSVEYSLPSFLETGHLSARLDWVGQGKMYVTPKISGNADLTQDAYNVVNARLTYGDIPLGDGTLSVEGWVKNIADEEYKIGGWEIDAGDPGAGGIGRTAISQYGEPRTYGVDIRYSFGSMR